MVLKGILWPYKLSHNVLVPRFSACGNRLFVNRTMWYFTGISNFNIQHQRSYSSSWFNLLSKFNNHKKTNALEKETFIIEEPNESTEQTSVEAKYFNEFKHYLKTTDIPMNLRRGIISDKLSEFIHKIPNFNLDSSTFSILNSVFLHLFNLNGRSFTDSKTGKIKGVLSNEDLMLLFEKSSVAITSHSTQNLILPEYMAILAHHYLTQGSDPIPVQLLVYVVDLGSSVRYSDLRKTLRLLVENKETSLTPEFTMHLLNYYDKKSKLNLSVFEDILFVKHMHPNANIIDDYFYNKFIEYVEKLYEDIPPRVHEYKNLEKDIDRIQNITNTKLIKNTNLDEISAGVLIKLMRLVGELDTVNRSEETQKSVVKILDLLVNQTSEKLPQTFENIRKELFKQNFGNESLAESLLLITWANTDKYSALSQMLGEYIESDKVKYSESLIFQIKAYDLIVSFPDGTSEKELTDALIEYVNGNSISLQNQENKLDSEKIDYSEMYNRIIQALVLSGKVSPRGYFTQTITNHFVKSFGIEPSVYSYKYRLDKAIDLSNHVQAINIFEDSLENFTQWPCSSDPTIHRSLNDLITLTCQEMEDIQSIFPIFSKIKQQMVNTQSNVGAIKAMAFRMLQAEYVGDLIEMLKRELPKINKDDTIKLPISGEYGRKYRELFDMLHNFVISYSNESTHETNWVLYGELHKYFHVPYESYLPAIRFFCEHDRLNAALIIFRQIRKLSELHGDHSHLPPLRDIYMYLFQVFGDKLYEEGVEEVHEYLKMDLNIPKQDIALQNAILNAYSNLQEVGKAKDLFISMSSVPKINGGINEETVQIMIKTYTYSDMIYVQKFWNNLSQYGIVPNNSIYKQYLIAHVYHGLVEDAIQLTEEMHDYDLEVSTDTLISMHNYCIEAADQTKVAEWAGLNHKEKWESVIASGYLKGAEKYMPENNLIVGSNNPDT